MIRFLLFALALALDASLSDAFCPVTRVSVRLSTIVSASPKEEPTEAFWMEDANAADEIVEYSTTAPKKDILKDTLAMIEEKVKQVDVEEVKETLSTTWNELSTKAKEFAEDERVQEIAAKAKEFAMDIADQIFTTVGEKLKELNESDGEKAKILATGSDKKPFTDTDADTTNLSM